MTSAIPVQRSTNWAIKPTGSWSICWVQMNHPSGEKWAARISYIRFFTAVQIYEFHIPKIVNIISIIILIIEHSTNFKNDTFSIDLDGFKWQCIQHLQNCQINKTDLFESWTPYSFTPLHQYGYSPYHLLHFSWATENLFNNLELP